MLTQYARELWVKYGVAMAIMVFRFFVRYRIHNGFVFDFTDLWCVVSTVSLPFFFGFFFRFDFILSLYASCNHRGHQIIFISNNKQCRPCFQSSQYATSCWQNVGLIPPSWYSNKSCVLTQRVQHVKAEFPTIIGLNAETALLVPDDRIAAYQRGSTIAHFDWVVYICMVFSFKGVMLCVLRKFGYVRKQAMIIYICTWNLRAPSGKMKANQCGMWFNSEGVKRTEKAVHYTIIFTTCSWMASVIAHFAGCAPIHRVWQVKPFPGRECHLWNPIFIQKGEASKKAHLNLEYCAGRPQNYYITGVLNMLLVLLPLSFSY